MYKKNRNKQLSFSDFNQPLGLQLNPENRWIKKAETIPWDAIEERYAELFPSNRGVPAKPLRMALGRLKKDPSVDRKTEYMDAVDRIEVERAFSLAKRSFGLGLITTRLENTTRSSIVLSVIAMNVDRLTRLSFMRILLSIFQGAYAGLSIESIS